MSWETSSGLALKVPRAIHVHGSASSMQRAIRCADLLCACLAIVHAQCRTMNAAPLQTTLTCVVSAAWTYL
eukprot:6178029-Pleurochrysis_carterae.AAC.2